MESLTIIYSLKIIGSIVLIILAASVCFGCVYYFFKCYNQEKNIDMLYEEISNQTEQYKELFKVNQKIEEKNIELEVKILEQDSEITKLKYINNGMEQSIGKLSFELKRESQIKENLTSNLSAARAKISILSKNVNIPEKDLVEFLLKYKGELNHFQESPKFIIASNEPIVFKRCLYCDELLSSSQKTFCNKEHQLAYQKNGFHTLNKTYTDEKM
jgi:hypothetical protein